MAQLEPFVELGQDDPMSENSITLHMHVHCPQLHIDLYRIMYLYERKSYSLMSALCLNIYLTRIFKAFILYFIDGL